MSKKGVAIVIGRAAVDDCYRNYLKEHPNEALAGYELTREERAAIAGIDKKALDKFSGDVSKRMRAWYVGWAKGC
jgi:hypothetical protein